MHAWRAAMLEEKDIDLLAPAVSLQLESLLFCEIVTAFDLDSLTSFSLLLRDGIWN
jgi:hypothetical protein